MKNDITLIVPFNEGLVDTDGDISAGIRVYPGRLQLRTILKLTEEPAYPERAVAVLREHGRIVAVHVTYSNEKGEQPYAINERDWTGTEFEDGEHAKGDLEYMVDFSTMRNPYNDVQEDEDEEDDDGQGDTGGAATGSDDRADPGLTQP